MFAEVIKADFLIYSASFSKTAQHAKTKSCDLADLAKMTTHHDKKQ